jgi:uncharacterized tellurite resistance protein B-like protein
MLKQITNWMKDLSSQNSAIPNDTKNLAQTIAELLVEAAMSDGKIDDSEHSHIHHMLVSQLDVADDAAHAMLDHAKASHHDRIEIYSLTRAIRSETDAADRSIILEMIWMVVLADGHIDVHESQLMRRLAGLLYVEDVESGLAAMRARARLGLAAG